jgi:hypothetical protein
MSEWIVCPGCHLKHSARTDGLCPRCHQPIAAFGAAGPAPSPVPAPAAPGDAAPAGPAGPEAGSPASPEAPATGAGAAAWAPPPGADAGAWAPPPNATAPAAPGAPPGQAAPQATAWAPAGPSAGAAAADASIPAGVRVAGALLVLLAITNLAVFAAGGGKGTSLVGASVIDLVLGGALALGVKSRGLVAFAIFRAIAGGLILGALLWSTQGAAAGIFQIVLSATFLLLLVGRAGTPRLVVGAIVCGLMICAYAVSAVVSLGGGNPLAELAAGAQGYENPVDRIEGIAVPWKLELPGRHWRPRRDEVVKKENAEVDRMVAWPARDAAIVIVAETVEEGQDVPLDGLTNVVVENARKHLKRFDEVSREPFPSSLAGANVVHVKAELNGQAIEGLYGVFVDGNVAIQVTGLVPEKSFAELEPELRQILGSLSL